MNDKPVIIVGLAIALVALTFPFWRRLMAGRPLPPPGAPVAAQSPQDQDVPAYIKPEGRCVANDMRASHMQLLNEWRDAVVREGDTEPVVRQGETAPVMITVTIDGEQCEQECPKSLTRGCMACHTSNENFCARCHEYADVHPTCWNCHVEPKDVASAADPKEE